MAENNTLHIHPAGQRSTYILPSNACNPFHGPQLAYNKPENEWDTLGEGESAYGGEGESEGESVATLPAIFADYELGQHHIIRNNTTGFTG